MKETSPNTIGFIDDLEDVKEKEVRLGDSPFMIDPETLVEVGTMNALVPDDGEEEEAVGKVTKFNFIATVK